MTRDEAMLAGLNGFKDGRGVAPALNWKFIEAACKAKQNTAKLLEAYITGWTIGHLSQNCTDPNMPSVKERARLESMQAA
jgi:hypothetical protein